MSLFKYCDLCNNSTSHQLVLKQVPCTALMITVLVLTLACCMLERSANKSLLWTQNAVSSLTSVQAHSKQISVCQEIVTSFRSRKPSRLYRAIFPRLYVFRKFQCSERKPIVTERKTRFIVTFVSSCLNSAWFTFALGVKARRKPKYKTRYGRFSRNEWQWVSLIL